MIPIAFPPLPGGGAFDPGRIASERANVRASGALSSKQKVESKEDAKIKEAALQFEGILVRELLQPLEASLAGGIAGEGASSPMIGGMIVNSLGQSITDGGGLGLAAVIEKSLRASTVEQVSSTTGKNTRSVKLPGEGETD
jgi:Rod binding domain-containing protein